MTNANECLPIVTPHQLEEGKRYIFEYGGGRLILGYYQYSEAVKGRCLVSGISNYAVQTQMTIWGPCEIELEPEFQPKPQGEGE